MIDLSPPPLLMTEPFRILRPLEGGVWNDIDKKMRGLGIPRNVRRSVIVEMKRTAGGKPVQVRDVAAEMAKYAKDPALGSMLINPFIFGGSAGVLDGLSPTGAWSPARDLLSSFAGNARYTTATGVDSLKDQTGGSGHFNQGGTGVQPTITTAGPNSRTCMDFDGSDDFLTNAHLESTFFANNSAFFVLSCLFDTISTDSSAPTSDQAVLADNSGGVGIALRSSGPTAMAYGFDGNFDTASATMPAVGTAVVLTWRHEGGTLYVSVNGGTEASVAHGNTFDLAYNLWLGRGFGGYMDGKICEVAVWNAVPDATTRNTIIIPAFMTYWGAT